MRAGHVADRHGPRPRSASTTCSEDRIYVYTAGETGRVGENIVIEGLASARPGASCSVNAPRFYDDEIELIRGATQAFDLDAYLAGRQTPVFFGSAISNFGVEELLKSFTTHAPAPQPRETVQRVGRGAGAEADRLRVQDPGEHGSGHRDRIAFMRLCSGKYTRGMRMRHTRLGKDVRIADALTFMAADRSAADEAFAGDIIGLHNHGTINIGDSASPRARN
jgi:peptide chain release factor 3